MVPAHPLHQVEHSAVFVSEVSDDLFHDPGHFLALLAPRAGRSLICVPLESAAGGVANKAVGVAFKTNADADG